MCCYFVQKENKFRANKAWKLVDIYSSFFSTSENLQNKFASTNLEELIYSSRVSPNQTARSPPFSILSKHSKTLCTHCRFSYFIQKYTVGTVSYTGRYAAFGKKTLGTRWGKIRRVLNSGTGRKDSKCASQCMLLGDTKRRRVDKARPTSDQQTMTMI